MKYLVSIIALTALLFSCSTERVEPKEELVEYESAENYLESKKPQEQEIEITQEGDGPLVGKEGSKIWISKELLQFPNGDSVSFPYTIKLVELYTPSDMIYYQMPSMSGTQLLTTHGEIRLRAFKDDTELILRPNRFWIMEIPNNNPINNMLCYYGNNVEANANWTNDLSTTFDSISSGYYGEIEKLGWVSCAQNAFESVSTINYNFYSDTISLSNVSTFIYLPEQEGLMQAQNASSYPLPIGESMKIVSIAMQGNQLFNYYTEQTISEKNQLEIILEQTTDAELTSLLNGL